MLTKKSKRLVSLFLSMVLILCVIPFSASAADIKLIIDGKTVASDVAPVVKSGTTLVPVRVATENLGAIVTWNANTRTATIKTAIYTVEFVINSTTYKVNGVSKTLNIAPELIGGRTMVPIRALSEAIGATVDYNAAANTATINYFADMSGSLKVSGSTTVQPIATAAADKLLADNTSLSISVAGGGSGAGIKEAAEGSVNIGMSSRELTSEEKASLNEFVIAHDGIAIIVHPSNGVKNLTKDQAKKIFTGEIKNWKDVGGKDAPILVQTRETGSGTLATLEELLLGKDTDGKQLTVVSTATPHNSTTLLKQAVAKSENAVGFISIGFVDNTVKSLSIGNIAPTIANITSGNYPISRNLLVVTKGTPGALAARYIDYLRSDACQKDIVEKEGYISIR